MILNNKLHDPQSRVIAYLMKKGTASAGQISINLSISIEDVLKILKNMENEGKVIPSTNPEFFQIRKELPGYKTQ